MPSRKGKKSGPRPWPTPRNCLAIPTAPAWPPFTRPSSSSWPGAPASASLAYFANIPAPSFLDTFYPGGTAAFLQAADKIEKFLADPVRGVNEWWANGELFLRGNSATVADLHAQGVLRPAMRRPGQAYGNYELLFVEDEVMILRIINGDYYLVHQERYFSGMSDLAVIQGYELKQDARFLSWAEAGLTTLLHLIPFGEAADLASQGRYREALQSGLMDGLCLIPGGAVCRGVQALNRVAQAGGRGARLAQAGATTLRAGAQAYWAYGIAGSAIEAVTAVSNIVSSLASGEFDVVSIVGNTTRFVVSMRNLRAAANMQTGCFAPGTLLRTPQGDRAIEDLMPGDQVYSAPEDDRDAPWEAKKIRSTFRRFAGVMNVHVDDGIIRVTAEHPFWVEGQGWIEAWKLKIGDLLRTDDDSSATVRGVADSGELIVVYNMEIDDYHTFFVVPKAGAAAVWVHNTERCPPNGESRSEIDRSPVRSTHFSESNEGIALHLEAQSFRTRNCRGTDPNANFAVARVMVNGAERFAHFVNDGNGGMHSEQRLIAWEERMKKRNKSVQVMSVYSERPPCGPNWAGCANNLGNRYGSTLPVYHSRPASGRGRR